MIKYGGMAGNVYITEAIDAVDEHRATAVQIVPIKSGIPMITANLDTGEATIDGKEYNYEDFYAYYVKNLLNKQYGVNNIYVNTSFRTSSRKSFAKILFSRNCVDEACYPDKVIYSGPCTIAFFQDGSKEIVRMCPDEKCDDREKAVMYAILKHAIGKRALESIFDSAKDHRDEE